MHHERSGILLQQKGSGSRNWILPLQLAFLFVLFFFLIIHHLLQASKKAQPCLKTALQNFQVELKKHQYFGDYFARSARKDLRLCCNSGWFDCQGPYNEKDCSKLHKINPYASKEARILFSTWNFDHV